MAKGKHVPGKHWKQSDFKRALTVFKSLGSINKTADVTGIPFSTLQQWTKKDWWKEGILQLKSEDSTQLEDAATNIARQAAEVVRERLTNGDFVLGRDGDLVRKPIGGRDSAVIMGIALEKRKALMDEEQRVDTVGTVERLLKLVGEFTKFANAKEIKGVLAEQREDAADRDQAILEHNENIEEITEHEETTTDYRLLEDAVDQAGDLPEDTQEPEAYPNRSVSGTG